MAFPQVADADTTTGGQTTDTTSHSIRLSGNRSIGDRLLVLFVADGGDTVSGWPSGWNVVTTQTTTGDNDTLVVTEKIVSGSGSNFSLTTRRTSENSVPTKLGEVPGSRKMK